MVLSYLLDATRSSHSIDGLALERAALPSRHRRGRRSGKGVKAVALDAVPAASLAIFAGERADLPLTLAPALLEDLEREGLSAVYRELEQPLIPVLADIERAGVKVDTDALAVLGRKMQAELDELCVRIYGHAGCEFNINSPKQLADVLFDEAESAADEEDRQDARDLHGAGRARGARARPRAAGARAQVARDSEAQGHVRRRAAGAGQPADRAACTRRSTRRWPRPGRLSSSDPNLQNIPIRTPLGREIRAAFVAEPGYRAHLRRLLADRAARARAPLGRRRADRGVSGRASTFTTGRPSACSAARRPAELDPHELRRRAKIINYALLYGKTAFTLAKDIGVPQQAAQEFIDAYFAGYPGVRAFIDQTLEDARATGVVRTITGRRRLVPELTSKNGRSAPRPSARR